MDALGINLTYLVAMAVNFFILFSLLVVLVGAGIWLVRRLQRQTHTAESPPEILKRRLAAGEIDEETYDRLRQRISEE